MKRGLSKLVVFLFLGAVVNVGVAWGYALKGSYRFTPNQYHSHATQPRWLLSVSSGVGVTRISVIPNNDIWAEQSATYRPEIIPYWSATRRRPGADVFDDLLGPWTLEFAYGWPLRSGLAVVRRNIFEAPGVHNRNNTFAIVTGTKVLEKPSGDPLPYRTIPIRPIMPGFVANSLIYAVMLWFLLLAPGHLRRSIRRKRGLCVNCGYDIRHADHDACPECGAAGATMSIRADQNEPGPIASSQL